MMKTDDKDKYTYKVTWAPEDEQYVGQCVEFPSLSWLAKTPNAALSGIRKVVADVIEDMLANDENVPEPLAARKYSGKFQVRIPPEVHRNLVIEAAEEHVSLNRLVSAKLTGHQCN
jgi:predicted HicB family RNase H-like nuclease